MAENDIRAERIKKVELLKKAGMEAYPARSARDATVAEFLTDFEERETSGRRSTLNGRIMSLRRQGGIVFADIFDGSTSLTTGGTGRVQIVLQESEVDKDVFSLFVDTVDTGDFLEVAGVAFKTKRGALSLKVETWRMLAKSLLPIPNEWFGLKDEEKRLRERDIDILMNAELRALVERRAKFWQSVREFYLGKGFMEVETPVLETTPGGADARPFVTHHNALDMDVYLRISCGELWQKRLLIIFRNEGQSREHLQDYTQLESYEAYSDVVAGMKFVQELYRHIAKETYKKYTFEIGDHTVDFAEEWKEINFSELIKKRFRLDPVTEIDERTGEKVTLSGLKEMCREAGIEYEHADRNVPRTVDNLWKVLRKEITGPAFLVGIPVYMEPLAKRAKDGKTVERVQILIAGSEMGKGYSELNDPQDQRARFEEQQKLRDKGDEEAQRLDVDYIRAMEYGMPPAFGFGVSERLFAFMENKSAHEAQLFPLLRPSRRE
ncbi:MAG: lysyl-tRNA synthetase [Parcubacteria group bacterium GW2011_GWB1_50_9]|nr:MAG: lysyl-tRNA synthetase [Parcubacteria group bacterium GW2011_GWB1_50_9]